MTLLRRLSETGVRYSKGIVTFSVDSGVLRPLVAQTDGAGPLRPNGGCILTGEGLLSSRSAGISPDDREGHDFLTQRQYGDPEELQEDRFTSQDNRNHGSQLVETEKV